MLNNAYNIVQYVAYHNKHLFHTKNCSSEQNECKENNKLRKKNDITQGVALFRQKASFLLWHIVLRSFSHILGDLICNNTKYVTLLL